MGRLFLKTPAGVLVPVAGTGPKGDTGPQGPAGPAPAGGSPGDFIVQGSDGAPQWLTRPHLQRSRGSITLPSGTPIDMPITGSSFGDGEGILVPAADGIQVTRAGVYLISCYCEIAPQTTGINATDRVIVRVYLDASMSASNQMFMVTGYTVQTSMTMLRPVALPAGHFVQVKGSTVRTAGTAPNATVGSTILSVTAL